MFFSKFHFLVQFAKSLTRPARLPCLGLVAGSISQMHSLKKYKFLVSALQVLVLGICFLSLNSCLTIPPHAGGLGYGSYTYQGEGNGVVLKDVLRGDRKGTACIYGDSIVPFFYFRWRGDASVRAAAANGGIQRIYSVERQFKRYFWGSVEFCTVVYGE